VGHHIEGAIGQAPLILLHRTDCRPCSSLPQAHVLEGRGPGKGVDQHQRRLLYTWPEATRPEVEPDGREHDALVHELLDLVQQGLAFRPVCFHVLLSEQCIDVRIAAAGERAIADYTSSRRVAVLP
jgi:hypothetical protein